MSGIGELHKQEQWVLHDMFNLVALPVAALLTAGSIFAGRAAWLHLLLVRFMCKWHGLNSGLHGSSAQWQFCDTA